MTTGATASQRAVVAGIGKQAREHRIPAALAVAHEEDVELDAVLHPDGDAAYAYLERFRQEEFRQTLRARGYAVPDAVAERFSRARVYSDLGEMLRRQAPRYLVSAVPNHLHAEVAVEGLGAGCHVLSEKPMAADPTDRLRMAEAARANDRLLMIGYHLPYMAAWPARVIGQGRLGARVGGRAHWFRSDRIPPDPRFWADPRAGGVTLDLGGHLASVLLRAVGSQPLRVKARGSDERGRERHGPRFASEDTVEATVVFANGARATIAASWADGGPADEEIGVGLYGDNGARLDIPLVPQQSADHRPDARAYTPVLRHDGGPDATTLGDPPAVYTACIERQARNFFRAAQGKEAPIVTLEQTLTVERLVDAIRESFRQAGAWVDVCET